MTATDRDAIVHEATYPHPIERVWAGLTIRDILNSGWGSKLLRENLPAYLDRMARETSEKEAAGRLTRYETIATIDEEGSGMLKDVSHVTVYVNDQDMALDYYTNVLGFEKRTDASFGEGMRWIEVGIPGTAINFNLIHGYGGWEPERVGKSTGILLSADDVRATIEELRGRGVKITMESESFPWGTNAAFKDMDGNSYVLGGP